MNILTKKMLADSLKKLMVLKPLNRISIREIVEDCGVNRQTFYYHFHDIYDLLEWMLTEETSALLSQTNRPVSLLGGVLQILKYIQQNEDICRCAFQSMGHKHLKKFFYEGIYSIILSGVNECARDLNVSENHRKFIAHFYTVSFTGFIENWLQEGLQEDPEEIIRLCEITMEGNIRGALERFSINGSIDKQ
jgi:probable dihydroxyacetone kinase regulator